MIIICPTWNFFTPRLCWAGYGLERYRGNPFKCLAQEHNKRNCLPFSTLSLNWQWYSWKKFNGYGIMQKLSSNLFFPHYFELTAFTNWNAVKSVKCFIQGLIHVCDDW